MYLLPKQSYGKPVVSRAVNAWVDIQAPAETVFRFLTEDEFLVTWWSTRCVSDPRPGGIVTFEWDGENAMTGEALYRELEWPRRVVLQWTSAQGEPVVSDGSDQRGMRWLPLNIYEIWPLGDGFCRLELHDYGVATDAKYTALYEATCEGWYQSLTRLKKAVEKRTRV
ncbi:MAG: SRPBCC domain-containing protein [Acidobacteria bacterium]|nr:SRPBCC domain-containing protein [Acidobacteriota bacterium]